MKPNKEKKNIFVDRKTLLKQKVSKASKHHKSKLQKPLSKREQDLKNKILRRMFIVSSILILVIFIVSGVFIWIKYMDFYNKIDSRLELFDQNTTCKPYNPNQSLITSFVSIDLGNDQAIKNIYLNIFDSKNKYSLNLNNYRIEIDNSGSKGTIIDYIKINNLFLDKKTLFKYLSTTLLRQLYIKIDYVLIGQNINVKDISEQNNLFYQYLFNQLAEDSFDYQITTDICKDSFYQLLQTYYDEIPTVTTEDYQDNFLSNFDFSEIRKEQVRIYLNNRSGVEGWGNFYRDLMQGYGLNIVKLDNSVGATLRTSISIDDNNLKDTNTLKMIKYLLNNQVSDIDVNTQTNIFSDIYIELGEDSLLNQ